MGRSSSCNQAWRLAGCRITLSRADFGVRENCNLHWCGMLAMVLTCFWKIRFNKSTVRSIAALVGVLSSDRFELANGFAVPWIRKFAQLASLRGPAMISAGWDLDAHVFFQAWTCKHLMHNHICMQVKECSHALKQAALFWILSL